MATGGALIGALRVSLGLDSAEFEAGTKKARATAKTQASAIQAEFTKLKNLGSSIAGVWVGSEIVAAGKRALDYASSLGEVAQQLGTTTKDLQLFRYMATQVGISQDEMDDSLSKLTRTIGEAAAGSKSQATAFRELGVSVEDGVTKRVLTAGEVLPRLADAFSQIRDPATRARLEVDLFGKAGQKIDTLLTGGSKAINQMAAEFRELGLEVSPEFIAKADDAADKMAKLKFVLEQKMAIGVAQNAKMIADLADGLAWLAQKAGEAYQNFSNLRNLRGLNFAGSSDAARNLLSNAEGRQSLKRDIQNRMDANMRARASGQGDSNALDAEFKNLVRGRNAVLRAERAAARIEAAQGKPSSTPGALPTVAASGGKSRGRSGPTAGEIEAKHEQELSRLRQEQLQAQLQLTNDAEQRADLQSQLLLEEYNERKAQIENDEHFTVDQKKAQVAALKALYGVSGEGDDMVVGGGKNTLAAGISRELQERLAREAFDLQSTEIEMQRESLQGQLNMARTAEERRRIELEILDLEYKLREAKLDQVINSQESSKAEKDLALMQKGKLGQQRALDTANVNRQNMGPMASYLDSLPKTAAEVNERFEEIAANGLANMNDQLAQAAANTLKLKGLAGQLFNQLIADVIRLNLQSAMSGTGGIFGGLLKIGGSLFGGGAGAGGPSIVVNQSRLSNAVKLPGLATGGTIGGFGGVDNNLLAINGVNVARVSASERIRVEKDGANDNGGVVKVLVEANDYFDARVAQGAASVAAPMAMASGMQARSAATSDVARKSRRRIPGRG